MRNCPLSLLSCAALLMACQPVTPTPMKIQSPSPNMEINDAAPIPPASIAPPVTSHKRHQAPVPAETLSSSPVDQNNNQTEIDLAIGAVTKSIETQTNSAQASSDITPKKMWPGPKPLIQQKLSALQHQFLSTILAAQIWFAKKAHDRSLAISVWKLCC